MSLKDGTAWVPELIVIALLSEWLIEEKKSTYFYPYLNKIDYVDVLSKYDNCRKNLKEDRKIIIMNMYKVSSKLIEQLKKVEYKVNRSRKRKQNLYFSLESKRKLKNHLSRKYLYHKQNLRNKNNKSIQ